MKVLVACERSGIVRNAFRVKGHDAWSCDLQASVDNSPYHIQGDVTPLLKEKYDLVIAHPTCTYLTVTGNKWFKPEYADRFPTRQQDRADAIDFFMLFTRANADKICIENPVGIMSTQYRKPDQIIQPWQFGHTEAKKTCLWLKNLPKLEPTNIVTPEYTTFKSGKRMATWYVKAASLSPVERSNVRSQTFSGIAEAMSIQWSV